jgi:hypothetical protein
MSKIKPLPEEVRTLAKSLIEQIYERVMLLEAMSAESCPEQDMGKRLDDLFSAATMLSQAPAGSIGDVALKLDVLCRRMRESTSPEHSGEVLTYMLAESIRSDCCVLSQWLR